MQCSKIGGECPHKVVRDGNFVFVMMPFANSASVSDAIKMAVEGIEGKDFTCQRADEKFTNLSIWCRNICKNIRKAKYVIVDTTGRNPNVFYELGFSHAMRDTKAIIITQNVKEAPFDIADLSHIEYSEKDLPELRKNLEKAILDLEKEEEEEEASYQNKTSEEVIDDLNSQLRREEDRARGFKNDLVESEKREKELKKQIRELESIVRDPVEEGKKKITELEGTIAELKSRIKLTENDKTGTIEQLKKALAAKEERLAEVEKKFETYKTDDNVEPLSSALLDQSTRHAEATKLVLMASYKFEKENFEKAIEYLTKSIELDPEYGNAYSLRGALYLYRENHEKGIADLNKAIELNPVDSVAYQNLLEAYISTGESEKALEVADDALALSLTVGQKAICLHLKCIARRILDMDIAECEKSFNNLLKDDFSIAWNFSPTQSWLEKADISDDKKAFIVDQIEQLKKHAR